MNSLLYKRLKGGWHDRLTQEMSELQEFEPFRKGDGVVRITFRFRTKSTHGVVQTSGDSHL